MAAVPRVTAPAVWSHSVLMIVFADSDTGTVEFEEEIVEILAIEGDAVPAEAAPVIRVPRLGACLGAFLVPE